MKMKMAAVSIGLVVLLFLPAAGYGRSLAMKASAHDSGDIVSDTTEKSMVDISPEIVPLSQSSAMFTIPMPAATGDNVVRNDIAEVDISNTKDGYIMARYLKITSKAVKVIIKGPCGTSYTYSLKTNGEYEVYPLSDGNGTYWITVYENVFGNRYFTVLQTAQGVIMTDEFAPFIRPNQYVNYNGGSKTVEKAFELTKDLKNTTDKISAVYDYVINNISYDRQLAASVKPGYLPDLDNILKTGKGICFDYAAVMTAMLRSQGIPAKLVVGYTGNLYHAWISAYSGETGWVDGIIYFDGKSWELMDPTFASGGVNRNEIINYIGNGKNYTAKYLY